MDIEEILGFQPDLIFFVALALGTPFQAGGGYKSPIKTQEGHIHHRSLYSVAPIFFGKEKCPTGPGPESFLLRRLVTNLTRCFLMHVCDSE